MNRLSLIAGNWKMYKTGQDAIAAAIELAELCSDAIDVEIMIAPPFLSLPLVSEAIKASDIKIGAQNLFYKEQGPFTGEVCADMIKDAGAEYVIIGHSERREHFGETDSLVQKRIKAVIQGGLKPILCIGETESQREQGKTFSILDKQVSKGVKNFVLDELDNLVLAYEPVWAIGTGKTANADQVTKVHKYLRSLLEKMFSKDFANQTRILYGGSVTPENAKDLLSIEDVDGALVGGASLDAKKFIKIITAALAVLINHKKK